MANEVPEPMSLLTYNAATGAFVIHGELLTALFDLA